MDYSIDTSALLDGWIRYYPPDTFDSLWQRLDELIIGGSLRATEEVRFELEKKADDVLAWTWSETSYLSRSMTISRSWSPQFCKGLQSCSTLVPTAPPLTLS